MNPTQLPEELDSYRLLAKVWNNRPLPRLGAFPFRRITQQILAGTVSAYDLNRWGAKIGDIGRGLK